MSYFRQIAQSAMNPALDSVMGEPVTVKPMRTRANFPAERDPTRPVVEAVAIFTWKSDAAFGAGKSGPHDRMRQQDTREPLSVVTRKPWFSFAAPAVAVLKRGDRIQRHADATEWEIAEVRPDGAARIEVRCVQLGLSNQGDQ